MQSLRYLTLLLVLGAAACGGSTNSQLSAIGGACKANADCASGLTCATDDPGGLCSKTCATNADCGDGAICNDEKECYPSCLIDTDCRASEGYGCIGPYGASWCDALPRSGVGGPCDADINCETGLTCATDDPGGLCSKTCATNDDCGAGAICNDEKECYQSCTANSDCRMAEGYGCVGPVGAQWCDTVSYPDGGLPGTTLTVKNYLAWCSVTVNGGTASPAAEQIVTVTPGTINLSAVALTGFQLGATPWHDTAGDTGNGDPGTVTGSGQTAASATTVVVGSDPKCVWVCCEFATGGGCPATDQCP